MWLAAIAGRLCVCFSCDFALWLDAFHAALSPQIQQGYGAVEMQARGADLSLTLIIGSPLAQRRHADFPSRLQFGDLEHPASSLLEE
jgi:hypothetical protein